MRPPEHLLAAIRPLVCFVAPTACAGGGKLGELIG